MRTNDSARWAGRLIGATLVMLLIVCGCGKESTPQEDASGKAKDAAPGASAKPAASEKRSSITLAEIRTMQPLCGKPYFMWTEDNKLDQQATDKITSRTNGWAAHLNSLPGPKTEKDKWGPAMGKATGVDFASNKMALVKLFMHLSQRMGVMFEEDGSVKPEMYNRLLARLESVQKSDLDQWQQPLNRLYGKDVSLVDVAISLLPADPLYKSDKYDAAKGAKYAARAQSLTKEDLDLWTGKAPAFQRARADAVVRIVLIDDFFPGDEFDRERFKQALSGKP